MQEQSARKQLENGGHGKRNPEHRLTSRQGIRQGLMSEAWKDYSQYHIAFSTFIRKNVDIDKELKPPKYKNLLFHPVE
jgi:hypothetical protein